MKTAALISMLVFGFSTAQAYTLTCSNSAGDSVTVNEQTNEATIKSANGEKHLTVVGFEDFYIEPGTSRFNIRADNNAFDIFKPSDKVGRWHTYYAFSGNVGYYLVVDHYDNGKHVAGLSTSTTDDGKILHAYQSCVGIK